MQAASVLEQGTGIEPTFSAWEADALPMQSEAIIADFPAQCKAKFACRHSFPYMPPAGGIGWGKGHKKECIP